jgi:ATP-dependent RNA helicase DeaD
MRMQRSARAIDDVLDIEPERLERYRDFVETMFDTRDSRDVALAAFALFHEATQGPATEEDDRDLSASDEEVRRASSAPASRGAGKGVGKDASPRKPRKLDGPTTRLFISVGRKARVTPGDIVGAITGEAGLKGKDIGAITVHELYSLVEVPEDKARKIAKSLNHCTIRGRKVTVRLDRG